MQISSFIQGKASFRNENLISKLNPYTSEVQHRFSSANLLETVTAIQSAQKFFNEYKQTSLDERLEILKRIKNQITENKLKYAKMEAQDQGLPISFVLANSIEASLFTLEQVISELCTDFDKKFSATGVISIFSSWNLSFRIISERLFPAIAAGNTVLVKISSMSPITAHILAEIIESCQLPVGLIQIILSKDPEVKKILATHPGIKAVSFVGQLGPASEILTWISSLGLRQFKKIQIATGTKNTAAVLSDPTENIFADLIRSFLVGQGQLAWNSSRLFVLEKYEKAWFEILSNYLAGLSPSQDVEDHSLWTPCLKEESFKSFEGLNKLAVQDQARLIQTKYKLNDKQKKSFLPITFTQDMSNCSTLQQDQVMLPLFILSSVKYAFDIPKYSNVSYFGFAAHLWGEVEKTSKIVDQLEVGLVCQNKWSAQIFGPFASVKQSGFGIQDYHVFGNFFSNVKKLA